jgi:glyoxylase-like metal-dependent hydrolase (beta-lactamase superfamily II)
MSSNLAAAGIAPEAIDAVILTHMHPDHAAGLLTPDKAIAFPNATVHVNIGELAFWSSETAYAATPEASRKFFDIARAAIKPYADAGRVKTFTDGAEILPGFTAVEALGHTPGHSMIRVASEGRDLLLWGDIIHNFALQFTEPQRSIAFDTDKDKALASRLRVLDMVATDKTLIAGSHLPFPGLGHVAKAGAGYGYVPVAWGADL